MQLSETCEKALAIMRRIVTTAAEVDAYPQRSQWSGWSDEFSRAEIKRAFEGYERNFNITPYESVDFWNDVFKLPEEEKLILGFRYWSKETAGKMLIPLWIVQCLPNDFSIEATSIMRNTETVSKKMKDKDQRAGCIAYMI